MQPFNLKKKKVLTPTATLLAGVNVSGELIRYKATVSGMVDGWVDAIAAAFKGSAKIIEKATYPMEKTSSGGVVVEGFAIARPLSYQFEGTAESAVAAMAEDHGRKLTHVASNIYMDEEEDTWSCKTIGDTTIVTRADTDNVMELIASASARNKCDGVDIKAGITNKSRAVIAYVDYNGDIQPGIICGEVAGDNSRVLVLAANENIGDEPQPIKLLQVVTSSELPIDWNEQDPIDYYRQLYSENPSVVDVLNEYLVN